MGVLKEFWRLMTKKIVKRRLYVSAFCGWDFRNKSNFNDK